MNGEVVVVGAGINGLSTAWQLGRMGRRVLVLDQHPEGHAFGSSHGATRITRSSYGDPVWVDLVREANVSAWPALEAEAGEALRIPRSGCFFGSANGPLRRYAEAAAGVVEPLTTAEAARRFPLFRFSAEDLVLVDPTAGIVAAARTLRALGRRIQQQGGTIRRNVTVEAVEPGPPHRLRLSGGETLESAFVVLCAGPWSAQFLPRAARPLRVMGQTVAFFEHPEADTCPPWAYIAEDRFFYGLPGRASPDEAPGLKAALHHTVGPDEGLAPVTPAPEVVIRFLYDRLTEPPGAPIRTETCRYTMTENERFVLDLLAPGLAVGAGFSGHSFKFGPLTGRILAELCINGQSDVSAFSRKQHEFSIGG